MPKRSYNSSINDFSQALKALSNPNRLKIFMKMAESCCTEINFSSEDLGPCCSDLGDGLDIAPSTLSHHLRELRIAGLIKMERRGKEIYCCVDSEALQELIEFFKVLQQGEANEPSN